MVLEESSLGVEKGKIMCLNRVFETVIRVSLSSGARLELVLSLVSSDLSVLHFSRKVSLAIGTLGKAYFTLAISDFGY